MRKRTIFIILLIIIILIFLWLNNKKQNNETQDDLIFFKLFSTGQQNTKNAIEKGEQAVYNFNVSYKNIDFKNISLSDTINKNTLIREKIAPGTKGSFEILLETNEKINYEIKFESKNEKPKNLNFQIEGQDREYKSLEDMENNLMGEISKNKKIIINWKWDYERNNTQDLQDTKDGENIKNYQFTIYAIGKQ